MATVSQPTTALRTFASPRLSFKSAAKAISFYEKAFGAKESWRFETEHGVGHAEVMIGDSVFTLCEEWPEGGRYSAETLGQSPISMTIQTPDVDAFVKHAVAAGAKLTMPPTDQFYGHRDASLLDPFGYTWLIATRKEEITAEEMQERFDKLVAPSPAAPGLGNRRGESPSAARASRRNERRHAWFSVCSARPSQRLHVSMSCANARIEANIASR